MARLARVVVAGVAHHMTRRGDWREFLSEGLETDEAERFRRHERTGRPLGQARFLERIEKTLGRVIRPHKRGPKPKNAEK
jgi:REP-associated tyrosine transposase